MQNAIEFIFSPHIQNQKIEGINKTPGDIGNSLFRDFLNRSEDSENQGNLGLNIFERDEQVKNLSLLTKSGTSKNSLLKLNKKLVSLGNISDLALLPETAAPHLVNFLENLGFSKEKIERFILEATNSDGFIQLDKLLNRILENKGNAAFIDKGPSFHSKDIPKLGETLIKMGLGTNEVKEVIEESANKRGEIDISRLTNSLNKFFPEPRTEKEIISLLEYLGIKAKPTIAALNDIDPSLNSELSELAKTESQDIVKIIKNDLAALLSDKGIPPQEIKRFLETLHVERSNPQIKTTNPENGTNNFMDQILLKRDPGWANNQWQEKIISILKNERTNDEQRAVFKDYGKNLSSQQENLRISLNEFLKNMDQKEKADFFNLNYENRGMTFPDVTASKFKNSGNHKENPAIKEILGNELSQIKIERDIPRVESVSQTRNVINLPEPLPKIFDRMTWMIHTGEQRSRIMIHPPELGRIDIELTLRNGHLQANLSAESHMIKELIEANLSQLKQQLSDQGLLVDKFEVMVGLDYRNFHRDQDGKAGSGRNFISSKSGTEDDWMQVEEISIKPPGMDLNQVDVHV